MKKLIFAGYLLLVVAVNINAQDIFTAAEEGNLKEVSSLLATDPGSLLKRDMTKTPGNTVLHYATSGGHKDVVEYLIDRGIDVNIKSYFGLTPLHIAAQKGHEVIVDFLIKKGAKIDYKDRSRNAPIFYAAYGGSIAVVERLTSEGIDLNIAGKNENTLLHAAVSAGHLELTRYLIDNSLDVDASNKFGWTPLHMAASSGNKEIVLLLLEHGADVNKKGLDFRTPLHLARHGNHQEVASILITNGAKDTPWSFPKLEGEYLGQQSPGLVPEIFAPGIISTDGREFASTISPDGDEFYYTASGGINALPVNTILVTRRIEGKWTEPEAADFSGEVFDFEPHISPDGNKLYFGSTRPLVENEKSSGMHQWVLEKSALGWSEAKSLPKPFVELFVMSISTAMDSTLYFTGRDGIYLSQYQNGAYLTPEKLPDQINFTTNPAHPYVAPDESYLIFDAMPLGVEEGARLFISFRKENGSWMQPINLSEIWDSQDPEMAASVSPDGKFIFFAREDNIYWVSAKIFEELKPKE